VLCRVYNLLFFLGEPIDERGPVNTNKFAAIHADAPEFVEMSVEQEILVTGIKVVDLLAPYAKGGKIGRYTNFCLQNYFFSLQNSLKLSVRCRYEILRIEENCETVA